ncbi:hypothetical protein ANN_17521 [Periplaneta americana]|uniref:Protein kinase domain-containing protein n=1 Tax=Periplaneta americana TaxID=6978 RepID=A0ABQ8STR3_PERAM|nr:hypothetical protein ANN_17521 [Periplaneta americana]
MLYYYIYYGNVVVEEINKSIFFLSFLASHIFRQVVQGLLYLHSHKILHRDMSLANLLLSKDMRVKIADFGLATQLARADEKHLTMCGTPNYISPEVATRSSHGLEADVWSLGCMLYTLLVGQPPFDTAAVKSTLTKVVMADYKVPTHLSPAARDLIDLLLKKNPRERIKLQNILDHPFMKRSHTEFLQQNHLPGDTADSGMGTMSTNTHSQETRDSFPTVNDHSTRSSPPLYWKHSEKLLADALTANLQLDSSKDAIVGKQTVKIMSRTEDRFNVADSSAKVNRPGYLLTRFNSNTEERKCALLPTLPSIQNSNLPHTSPFILHDKFVSKRQVENYNAEYDSEINVTSSSGGKSNCVGNSREDMACGNKITHAEFNARPKYSVSNSSYGGECCKCSSNCNGHHSQCSGRTDDVHASCTGTCSHPVSNSAQNSVLTAASCSNSQRGRICRDKEEDLGINNCLIRSHSVENARSNSQCSKSNCNCRTDSATCTQTHLHGHIHGQCQKCNCRRTDEHFECTGSIKQFSNSNCMCKSSQCSHYDSSSHRDCKSGNCSHFFHSHCDNTAPLHDVKVPCPSSNLCSPLHKSNSCTKLNSGQVDNRDMNDYLVFQASNECLEKQDLEQEVHVEVVKAFDRASGNIQLRTLNALHILL